MQNRKIETPEEKATRLERHKKYMEFILVKFFRKKSSDVFKSEYYHCKTCEGTFAEEKDAIDHYFKSHWSRKNGNSERSSQ